MASLGEIRAQYPQYADMPDSALADALHKKFYADMPRAEFDAKVGYDPMQAEAQQNYTAMHGDRRPVKAGDEVSRDTILPFREVQGANGKPQTELAVPGIIAEPVRSAARLFTGGTAPGPVPLSTMPQPYAEQQIGDVMSAGSLAMTGTRIPAVTAESAKAFATAASNDAALGPVIQQATPQPAKTPLGGAPRDELMAAGQRLGVDIPVAAASDSDMVRGVAGRIASIPVAGSPVVRAARAVTDQLDTARQGLIDDLGGASKPGAGQTARQQIEDWITTGSKTEASQIYKPLEAVVDGTTRVPLSNLTTTMDAVRQRAANMRQEPPSILKMFEAAATDPKGFSFRELQDLRTQVGLMLEGLKVGPQAGIDDAALKQLYGALSEDLTNVVRASGKATKAQELQTAGGRQTARDELGVTRLTKGREQQVLDAAGERAAQLRAEADARFAEEIAAKRDSLRKIIGNDAATTPETVVQRLRSYANTKGGADIGRLQQAVGVLDETAKTELRASIIAEMGVDKNGFSPEKFRTELAKMSEAGRQTLFSPEINQILSDIDTIGQRLGQLQRMGNPSGTAGAGAIMTALGTAGTSIATASTIPVLAGIATTFGAYVLAKMLARPATARVVRDYMQAHTRKGRAAELARAETALREAAATVQMQTAGQERRPGG